MKLRCMLLACLALWAAPCFTGMAQLIAGSQIEDFDKAFHITAKNWEPRQVECSLDANVLWPGQHAAFTFFIKPARCHNGVCGHPSAWRAKYLPFL